MSSSLEIPTYEDFLQQAMWWIKLEEKQNDTANYFLYRKVGSCFYAPRAELNNVGESYLCLLIAEMLSTGDFE